MLSQCHVDIARSPQDKPSQPYIKFPAHHIGQKKRSFNPRWYSIHHWIEYSVQKDAAYCYPCRLLTTNPGRSDPAFVDVGYSDWKHATGKKGAFVKHEKSYAHNNAMVAWRQYEEAQNNRSTLPHQLNKM